MNSMATNERVIAIHQEIAGCDTLQEMESDVLPMISRFLKADAALVIGVEGRDKQTNIVSHANSGIDDHLLRQYGERHADYDPVIRHLRSAKRRSKPTTCKAHVYRMLDICPPEKIRRTRYFREFLSDTGVSDILILNFTPSGALEDPLLAGFHSHSKAGFSQDDLYRAKMIASVLSLGMSRIFLRRKLASVLRGEGKLDGPLRSVTAERGGEDARKADLRGLSQKWGLTQREAEVFALISRGLNNPEISRELGISVKTVEHHVSSILSKAQMPSRTRLISCAHSH